MTTIKNAIWITGKVILTAVACGILCCTLVGGYQAGEVFCAIWNIDQDEE